MATVKRKEKMGEIRRRSQWGLRSETRSCCGALEEPPWGCREVTAKQIKSQNGTEVARSAMLCSWTTCEPAPHHGCLAMSCFLSDDSSRVPWVGFIPSGILFCSSSRKNRFLFIDYDKNKGIWDKIWFSISIIFYIFLWENSYEIVFY